MTAENSSERPTADELLEILSGDCFDQWYRDRQYRDNIKNGTPYFNGSGTIPDPERHSPSKLLQCHRKTIYQQRNAPEEQPDPNGIFWIGTQFEEDIALPFLESVAANTDAYIRNTVWIDFRIETESNQLRIKGVTDPLIVDADAVPILPTEIKTKASVDDISSPNRHHRAQLHAYMVGLSEKYDIDLTDGALLYGSRKSLSVKIFHVEFDEEFWNAIVLEWAKTQTEYRVNRELPPGQPEQDWECRVCSFRQRCGKGDRRYTDADAVGLLPGFTAYPRKKVVDYLKAHDGAKLTPSLAHQHPDLAEEFGVYDWQCPRCDGCHRWDSPDWDGDITAPPRCPDCFREDSIALLIGPMPEEQSRRGTDEHAA